MTIIIQNKPKDYGDVFNTNTFERGCTGRFNWLEINDRKEKKKKEGVDEK
jgi:hypothetical protein|tara:strand:+ start:93 stop:242 length:150 start_codon:yes stop_codon:yes gene_type:complete